MAAPECLLLLLILSLAWQKMGISAQVSDKALFLPGAPERPTVSITDHIPGCIIVSWEPHLTEHMRNFTVWHKFFHKFPNEKGWITERTPETQARIHLNSHSNVWIQVNTGLYRETVLKSTSKPVAESKWTEVFYSAPTELLNAPRNVTLNPEEGDLRVTWVQPLALGPSPPDCFLYQVELKEGNKKLPQHEKTVKGIAEYIFPSYDKTKKYSVRVRAKTYCIESEYWGQWSEPVFIGQDDGVAAWIVALIILVPIAIICLLLRYMCKRYGQLNMIFTTIPAPSNKLKQWLASNESYREHFVFVQNEVVTTVEVLTD